MGRALAQVVFPSTTGLAANAFVNTFHFETAGVGVTFDQGLAIGSKLAEFYTDVPAGSPAAIEGYFSGAVAGSEAVVKTYDLDAPEPNYPVVETTFDLEAHGGNAFPNEVAIVLSFRAALESGVDAARRRNRIYLGPLNTLAASFDSGDVRPTADFMLSVMLAAVELRTFTGTPEPVQWRGYSPTDDLLWVIRTLRIDNAMDTQRRRGVGPSGGETVSIPVEPT